MKRFWRRIWLFFIIVSLFSSIIFIFFASIFAPLFADWTGFAADKLPPNTAATPIIVYQQAKTLWDWLQLILVPLVLAAGGFLLTRSENRYALQIQERREKEAREIEEQRTQDTAFQAYLDQMTHLLLEMNLLNSQPNDVVRQVARSRTLTLLRRVEKVRKGAILQFLYEAGLINYLHNNDFKSSIISLQNLDLTGIELVGAKLNKVDLSKVNFSGANLREANFSGANLQGANFQGANLRLANFSGANLAEANLGTLYNTYIGITDLTNANLEGANLQSANFYKSEIISTNLKNTNLNNAYFKEALLDFANFDGATLRDAYIVEASLTGASLKNTDLSHADFTSAQLSDTDFSNAKLNNAILRKAKVGPIKLDFFNELIASFVIILDSHNFYQNTIVKRIEIHRHEIILVYKTLNKKSYGSDFSKSDLTNCNISLDQLKSAKSFINAKLPIEFSYLESHNRD